MQFGIDTFSWGKLIFLKNDKFRTLIMEIIEKGNFFMTQEVKTEFEYRFANEIDLLKYITIFPQIEIDFTYYNDLGFDPADASLLEYSKDGDNIIITEDQLMLDESIANKRNIIQLADYFGLLFEAKFLDGREFYHIVKLLRNLRNISKKKEKELLALRTNEK